MSLATDLGERAMPEGEQGLNIARVVGLLAGTVQYVSAIQQGQASAAGIAAAMIMLIGALIMFMSEVQIARRSILIGPKSN